MEKEYNCVPDTNYRLLEPNGVITPKEAGRVYHIAYDRPDLEATIASAIQDARNNLKPGQVFELRCTPIPEGDYLELPEPCFPREPYSKQFCIENWRFSWYWNERMTDDLPLIEPDPAKMQRQEDIGYCLFGRLKA